MTPARAFQITKSIWLYYQGSYDVLKYGFRAFDPSKMTHFQRRMFTSICDNYNREREYKAACAYLFTMNHVGYLNEMRESLANHQNSILTQWRDIESPAYHVPRQLKAWSEFCDGKPFDFMRLAQATGRGIITPASIAICQKSFGFVDLLKGDNSSPILKMYNEKMAKYSVLIEVESLATLHNIRDEAKDIFMSCISAQKV